MATKKQLAARALFAKRARSGAFRKNNPRSRTFKPDPAYWVFTIHDGYISFRSDSGFTGSNPFAVIPGGKTPMQKAHANAKWVGLKRSQYEVIDAREDERKKNPFTKGVKKAVTRGRKVVRAVSGGLKKAQAIYRALHPGKALPASLASRKKRIQKNPAKRAKQAKRYYCVDQVQGGLWYQVSYFASKSRALAYAQAIADKHGVQCRVKFTFPSGNNAPVKK